MIEKEYYRFDELEKRFELSLSDLRYLVESSKIELAFYLEQNKFVIGGWLKDKGYVGLGTANYRGLVKITKQEQYDLLSNDKTTIKSFNLLRKEDVDVLNTDYPFESKLPHKFLYDWKPVPLSSLNWSYIPAKLFPKEQEHGYRALGRGLNNFARTLTGKDLELSDKDAEALNRIPEKSFYVEGIQLSHKDICLLHEDLVNIGIFKPKAMVKTAEIAPPQKSTNESLKRTDDLNDLLINIVKKHPEFTAKEYWRVLEDETEEVEGFRLLDKYNILSEIEGNQIKWQDRTGKSRKPVSFTSFTNRLTQARKKALESNLN